MRSAWPVPLAFDGELAVMLSGKVRAFQREKREDHQQLAWLCALYAQQGYLLAPRTYWSVKRRKLTKRKFRMIEEYVRNIQKTDSETHNRGMKLKERFLSVLLMTSLVMPTSSFALFGVGDIVHDPWMMAGMFGQTGAQIAQLVQTYQVAMQMYSRISSLAHIHNWRGFIRRWAKRELANISRTVIYDIQKRGARISSETPRNPLLSSMISGRNELNRLERKFNSGTFATNAYRASDWNIARRDRESVIAARQAAAEVSAARVEGQFEDQANSPAVAPLSGNTRTDGPITDLYGGNSDTTQDTSQNADGSDASNTGSYSYRTAAAAAPSSRGPAYTGSTKGSLDYGDPDGFENPGAVGMTDSSSGKAASEEALSNDPANSQNLSLFAQGRQKLDAGVLQEYDAAIKYVDESVQAQHDQIEDTENMDVQGPEPYLRHMIGQNDTVINFHAMMARAARVQEEKAQLEHDMALKQSIMSDPAIAAAWRAAIARTRRNAGGDSP